MKNPFDNEQRQQFRETVKRFVEKEVTPYVNDWDEAGEIPWELHQKTAELGAFGFDVDERYGGLGFDDCFMRVIFAEEFAMCGAGGVSAAMGGRNISIAPIHAHASDDIRDKVLPEIVSGRKSSSLAITEPSGGSDVANLKTSAKKHGNGYLLNGEKTFITGGMKSDFFVVGARTGEKGMFGVSLFFVEADSEGFSRNELPKKMGWWCSDQASLYFDDVFVPASNMLGPENQGFMVIMNNFNFERIGLAAAMLGMMKAAYEDAIAWAKERQTFGKPLIRHQVIRHKLADIAAQIDMIESYLNIVCYHVNEGNHPLPEIARLKFSASKALEFCASEAMQILGGAGYLRGNRVERIYREVKVMAIGGGSEEIMRDLSVRMDGL